MSQEKCKHRKAWIINGGYGLWCYECGAYRQSQIKNNTVVPLGKRWIKPTGIGGENPASKLLNGENKDDKILL